DLDAKSEMFGPPGCKLIAGNMSFEYFIKFLHAKIYYLLTATGIKVTQPKILRCDREGKYSAHIVYNVAIVSNHAKCIPKYIVEELRRFIVELKCSEDLIKCIDMGVYKS